MISRSSDSLFNHQNDEINNYIALLENTLKEREARRVMTESCSSMSLFLIALLGFTALAACVVYTIRSHDKLIDLINRYDIELNDDHNSTCQYPFNAEWERWCDLVNDHNNTGIETNCSHILNTLNKLCFQNELHHYTHFGLIVSIILIPIGICCCLMSLCLNTINKYRGTSLASLFDADVVISIIQIAKIHGINLTKHASAQTVLEQLRGYTRNNDYIDLPSRYNTINI